MDLIYFRGSILLDPFREISVLDRVRPGSQDVMEELEGFIRFQEPWGDLKGVFQALPVLVVAGAPVADLVKFAGLKEADDAFDLFIAFGITGILELVLIPMMPLTFL